MDWNNYSVPITYLRAPKCHKILNILKIGKFVLNVLKLSFKNVPIIFFAKICVWNTISWTVRRRHKNGILDKILSQWQNLVKKMMNNTGEMFQNWRISMVTQIRKIANFGQNMFCISHGNAGLERGKIVLHLHYRGSKKSITSNYVILWRSTFPNKPKASNFCFKGVFFFWV